MTTKIIERRQYSDAGGCSRLTSGHVVRNVRRRTCEHLPISYGSEPVCRDVYLAKG